MLRAVDHALEGPAEAEGQFDATATGAARVEEDGATVGGVARWHGGWTLDQSDIYIVRVAGVQPVEGDGEAGALVAWVAVMVAEDW